MEIRTVKLSELKSNPSNPRFIKDNSFKKLVKSIKDFPEMRDIREIVVNKDMVILGGNMRYRAMKEAGINDVRVKIVELDEQKQKEFIVKDNIESGEWDWEKLANEWDKDKLEEWGLITEWEEKQELSDEYSKNIGEVIYEPKNTNHKITDLYTKESKFDKDIDTIENEELKQLFRARVSFFYNFDFTKIADYYAYQATPEEKKLFEKLALVLLDKDQLIENGFSDLLNKVDNEMNNE